MRGAEVEVGVEVGVEVEIEVEIESAAARRAAARYRDRQGAVISLVPQPRGRASPV